MKNKKTLAAIQAITDKCDACIGECKEATMVVSHYLNEAGIEHRVYTDGSIRNRKSGAGWQPHMWVEVDAKEGVAIIDYRARHWLGEVGNTPHGVFLKSKYPHMQYSGKRGNTYQFTNDPAPVAFGKEPEHIMTETQEQYMAGLDKDIWDAIRGKI